MSRGQRRRRVVQQPAGVRSAGLEGGRFRPLASHDLETIVEAAFDILGRIGMAGAPGWLRDTLAAAGHRTRGDGRIVFSRERVEAAIASASRRVELPGFTRHAGLQIGGGHVHIGTGGAAVKTLDQNGEYRDSSLLDLYQLMRVLHHCENIHYGVRPLVARDMDTTLLLDINTAYACMRATDKPIGVSFDQPAHVTDIVSMFDMALGGAGAFRKRPFCMAVIVHVVPPLAFSTEGVDTMHAAIRAGMPLQICSAGQAGATSPASLSGALAQGLAESLAGLMVVDALAPGHPCIFALMPFVSDLRTGAMTGGSGEVAVASAAAAQALQALDLPATVCAGMTDAKVADVQAGYEKGYTVALAAQAGADMINLSVGMLGSIMVASAAALVIDDEMCGAILRSVRGIDAGSEHLDLEVIERVVCGEGHYLGEAQTLSLMKTEYVYPRLGDRSSITEWMTSAREPIWTRAEARVRELLDRDPPMHMDRRSDERIRANFPIRLDA